MDVRVSVHVFTVYVCTCVHVNMQVCNCERAYILCRVCVRVRLHDHALAYLNISMHAFISACGDSIESKGKDGRGCLEVYNVEPRADVVSGLCLIDTPGCHNRHPPRVI